MEYILNIHTATETAIVSICCGEKVLATSINKDPKQHAAFLHSAIHVILQENDILISQLKAIGVTNGPGSYTGIRVGLATAKGLCYALKIPLITFNTLEVMALSAVENIQDKNALYCPMIDARRMEVFTAVYNYDIKAIIPPSAMIITENSFEEKQQLHPIYFFGNGSQKFKNQAKNIPHSYFIDQEITSKELCKISWGKYQKKEFDNVAYAEPLYVKEFFSTYKIEK